MLFFGKKKDKKNYYFGLFLKSEEAVSFVFEVVEGNVAILGYESCVYSNGWENIVYDIDSLLARLEKQTNTQPKQAIFFVYSYFVNPEGDLKEPYKSHVKSISRQLELKPLGYIECYEVVASYLEERDKAPLNVILVELDKKNVDVCVYKASKKIIYRSVARTGSLIDDLSSIFNEVKDLTLLPSRLVLYDSIDIDEESVKILSHKWEKDVFVQHPRVEVIKQENLYTQLAQVFIKQLNSQNSSLQSVQVVEQSVIPEESQAEKVISGASEVATESPIVAEQISPQEKMGFVIDQPQTSSPKKNRFVVRRPKFKFPKFKMSLSGGKTSFILVIIGLLLIVGSLFALEYHFHKASVKIILPSKNLEKQISLDVSYVQTGTISATVKDSAPTTGKRDVGEKAVGQVTVHNFEDSVKVFSKGLEIEVDGRKFLLDQDVSVSSASEVLIDGDPVKKPGKASVRVTAKDIGPEGNLSKDKRFKMGTLSTSLYFAVNEAAFTGGTKKTVKTVAKKDIDDLKKILTEKAKKEVADKVQSVASNKSILIDSLTQIKITGTETSHEIAEEASQLTVAIDVEATYYAYDPDMLKQEVANQFGADVPTGYQLDQKRVSYEVTESKLEDGNVTLMLDAQAVAAKSIADDRILSLISGKTTSQVEEALKNDLQVAGFSVDVKAPVPFMKNLTPFFKKNIILSKDTQ